MFYYTYVVDLIALSIYILKKKEDGGWDKKEIKITRSPKTGYCSTSMQAKGQIEAVINMMGSLTHAWEVGEFSGTATMHVAKNWTQPHHAATLSGVLTTTPAMWTPCFVILCKLSTLAPCSRWSSSSLSSN